MSPAEIDRCVALAPEFLTSDEVTRIKSKLMSSSTYFDNRRKELVIEESAFAECNCLCFRATSFEWSTYRGSDMKATYFIEFKVSKAIKISEINFDIRESLGICYRIIDNSGRVLQIEENTISDSCMEVRTPILLKQFRRYRIEYEIIGLEDDQKVEAYEHVVEEKRMLISGGLEVECTIFRQSAHIYFICFQF